MGSSRAYLKEEFFANELPLVNIKTGEFLIKSEDLKR
jgi:hypothetical protein